MHLEDSLLPDASSGLGSTAESGDGVNSPGDVSALLISLVYFVFEMCWALEPSKVFVSNRLTLFSPVLGGRHFYYLVFIA